MRSWFGGVATGSIVRAIRPVIRKVARTPKEIAHHAHERTFELLRKVHKKVRRKMPAQMSIAVGGTFFERIIKAIPPMTCKRREC